MDLEQMKQGWNVLNERLVKQEIVNDKIVKEMISQKTQSAHDKIYKGTVSTLLNILFGGILLVVINMMLDKKLDMTTFIIIESYIVIGFIYQLYMLYVISRFNLAEMKLNVLMKQVLRYRKLRSFNFRTGVPSVIMLIGLVYASNHAFTVITISATAVFFLVAFVLGYIQYKRQNNQLHEIEQGLDELRCFEE